VEFTDPLGRPAQWVTENDVVLVGPGDVPVTARTLYANGSGHVSWTRIGAKDQEGTWTVRVTIGGEVSTVTYPVTQLQLPLQDPETVGVELRRYQGSASDTFYSTLVSAATTVDLQAHLVWVIERLGEELGVQSKQIPDIYLAGNQTLLQQVAEAVGDEIGDEEGYFRGTGDRPGIFMRTNLFRSSLQAVLTHEYTHLLLQEVAPDRSLPAWLNEGLARHSEYGLGLQSVKPDAFKVLLYRAADLAKSSALSGSLLSLTSLESQTDWNAQSDDSRVGLQYAESYMAVRFMAETHGSSTPINVVQAMGRGSPLAAALLEVTGSQYQDFWQSFMEWLQGWEDPERAGIQSYLRSLEPILDSVRSISGRRAADIQSEAPFSSRIPVKRGIVADAQALLDQLAELSPPALLTELHRDASAYLNSLVRWLTLELEYVETLDEAKLLQANDMIPEINARDSLLLNAITTVQFVYNLE